MQIAELDRQEGVQQHLPLVSVDVTSNLERDFARANFLLEAAYSLNIDAARLLECALNFVTPSNCIGGRPPVQALMLDDLRNAVPAWQRSGSFARRISVAANELWGAEFGIVHDGGNAITRYRWLETETRRRSGSIEIQLSTAVLPYVLELKSRYGKVRLSDQLGFSTFNAKRVHEIVRARSFRGTFEIYADELCLRLDIAPRESAQVRKRILDPALKQINELTNQLVHIEEPIKRGRRIIGWKLSSEKARAVLESKEKRDDDVLAGMRKLGVRHSTQQALLAKYTDGYLRSKLTEVQAITETSQIDKPAGLFISRLEEGIKREAPVSDEERKSVNHVIDQSNDVRVRLRSQWRIQQAQTRYNNAPREDQLEINRAFLNMHQLDIAPARLNPSSVPLQYRDQFNRHLVTTFSMAIPDPTAVDLDNFAKQFNL